MLELIFAMLLGIAFGFLLGLAPGIHPNTTILLLPLFLAIGFSSLPLLIFLASMAITNAISDIIPSILLGAPDNELSVLPGHRMLLLGQGYQAIKLSVIGSIGAIIFVTALMPIIFFGLPNLYAIIKPYIFLLLILISAFLIYTEKGANKKAVALLCFLLAGIIGLFSQRLPIDNNLVLFPILSGFFGISMLLLQIKSKTEIPEQKEGELYISKKTINRSVIFGSLGGVLSGFLPGVGSSQIAAIATIDKNDRSFLITNAAINAANALMAMLSLYLISKPRSGVAVMIEQAMNIGFNESLIIIAVSLAAAGIAALLTLKSAKIFVKLIRKIDYSKISIAIITLLVFLTFLFTGFYGLLLLATCTALGIFVNLSGIRRGLLMGALIIPTILFYLGV